MANKATLDRYILTIVDMLNMVQSSRAAGRCRESGEAHSVGMGTRCKFLVDNASRSQGLKTKSL